MRTFVSAILLTATILVLAQDRVSGQEPKLPKHYISVNPLNMQVAGESKGPNPIKPVNPPREETLYQRSGAINFTINFGVVF